jgi:two-component system, LuxR family, sensor kinase FixL
MRLETVFMTIQGKFRGFLRYAIIIYVLLVIGIGTTGWIYYNNQKEAIKHDKQGDLAAVATLKVNEIARWRQERLDDAIVIKENSFIVSAIYRWFADPRQVELKQHIREWLWSLESNYDYSDIMLLDTRGAMRMSISGDAGEIDDYMLRLTDQALRTNEIIFSDLHTIKNRHAIHIDMLIPLYIRKGPATLPIGVIVARIDPDRFFYPLIQSWPTPVKTAETLIVRREGDDVLYLNELRYRKNTALTLRVPAGEQQLPAAMAARGILGIVEGLDYRGTKVLAVIKKIPVTPWILIAKIDDEEVYAPVRRLFWTVMIEVGVLIATAGIIIGFIWHRQGAQFYRRQYEAELEHNALSQRYEYLTRYATDIILLLDPELNIVEANERAISSYLYSHEELLGLNIRDLRTQESRMSVEETSERLEREKRLVFETVHRRKDGSMFPVEISAGVMEVDGKKFYHSIIRDITERKAAEKTQVRLIGELANVNCELNDFAQIVSHDLKAPLRAIGALARWLADDYADKFDERGREQVNLLINRVKRLDTMIGCILKYSQVGRVNEDKAEVNLNELVTTVIDMLAPPAHIKVRVNGELPTIVCQKTRIEQVFQNLVGNAIKFMDKPAGEIRIACSADGECWKFSIADNGPGIEEKYFERIFQIFQTLKARDDSENTGIGLALVRRIVEMYGGKVWVESMVGRGSTFYFTLKRDMSPALEKGAAA